MFRPVSDDDEAEGEFWLRRVYEGFDRGCALLSHAHRSFCFRWGLQSHLRGSVQDVKAGSGMKIYIEGDHIRLAKDGHDLVTILAASVTEISYGQDVHRRVGAAVGLAVVSLGIGALMALSKSKKHYVGDISELGRYNPQKQAG